MGSLITNTNISDFTLLLDKEPRKGQLKKDEFVGICDPKPGEVSFNNLSLVEVKDGNRVAFPVNIAVDKNGAPKISFGEKIGEMKIAGRTFQNDFFGKSAKETTKPGTFKYIKEQKISDGLEYYTPDVEALQKDDSSGKTLTTDSFTTRHLSVMSKGVTYDILGIKGTPVYEFRYDPNGATGGAIPMKNQTLDAGTEIDVLGNTGYLVKDDCYFVGWNTKADGTGKKYVAGEKLVLVADSVLYAQWREKDAAKFDAEVSTKLVPEKGEAIPKGFKEDFTFKLEPLTDKNGIIAPMPKDSKKDSEGKYYKLLTIKDITGEELKKGMFDNLVFKKPGTYKYRITEIDEHAKAPTIFYDKAEYEITFEVKDVEGPLEAVISNITKDDKVIWSIEDGKELPENAILFVNKFKNEYKPKQLAKKKPTPLKSVKTGDENNILPFIVILVASGIVLTVVIIKKRKNK